MKGCHGGSVAETVIQSRFQSELVRAHKVAPKLGAGLERSCEEIELQKPFGSPRPNAGEGLGVILLSNFGPSTTSGFLAMLPTLTVLSLDSTR